MKTLCLILAFGLIGCSTHSPTHKVWSNQPIFDTTTGSTDPGIQPETRPNLTIELTSLVGADYPAGQGGFSLRWMVIGSGPAQTLSHVHVRIMRNDSILFFSGEINSLTIPGIFNGPNNDTNPMSMTAGIQRFTATVDNDNTIDESIETDNTDTIEVAFYENGTG